MNHTTSSVQRSVLMIEIFRIFLKEVLEICDQLLPSLWIKVNGLQGSLPIRIGLVFISSSDIRDVDSCRLRLVSVPKERTFSYMC